MSDVALLEENAINDYLKKDNEYKISYEVKISDYKEITLKTNLELITPGLKNILKNPYTVKGERNIVYE